MPPNITRKRLKKVNPPRAWCLLEIVEILKVKGRIEDAEIPSDALRVGRMLTKLGLLKRKPKP